MYRLLKKGEQLQKGDEFLEEDNKTWSPVPSLFLKCKAGKALQPIRRKMRRKEK